MLISLFKIYTFKLGTVHLNLRISHGILSIFRNGKKQKQKKTESQVSQHLIHMQCQIIIFLPDSLDCSISTSIILFEDDLVIRRYNLLDPLSKEEF